VAPDAAGVVGKEMDRYGGLIRGSANPMDVVARRQKRVEVAGMADSLTRSVRRLRLPDSPTRLGDELAHPSRVESVFVLGQRRKHSAGLSRPPFPPPATAGARRTQLLGHNVVGVDLKGLELRGELRVIAAMASIEGAPVAFGHAVVMTDELNVFNTRGRERELGTARGTRLGPTVGAEQLGCSLYELDPGGQAAPYHTHYANEELLIVLDGTLELRTPPGIREVKKGAVVGFPAGPDGAHRLRNVSDAPARYLLISTMLFPEVAEQLDTGTVLALKGPADGWAFPSGTAGDYIALTLEAIKADRGA